MSKRFEQQKFVPICELIAYCAFFTGFTDVSFERNKTKRWVLSVLHPKLRIAFYLNQKNVSLTRHLRINELLKDWLFCQLKRF